MSAQEDTFISHLVELRDRLLRAVVAVVMIFAGLMPWAGDIYDILAHPMMQALPEGTRMIATGVVTPFFVPMKVTLMEPKPTISTPSIEKNIMRLPWDTS